MRHSNSPFIWVRGLQLNQLIMQISFAYLAQEGQSRAREQKHQLSFLFMNFLKVHTCVTKGINSPLSHCFCSTIYCMSMCWCVDNIFPVGPCFVFGDAYQKRTHALKRTADLEQLRAFSLAPPQLPMILIARRLPLCIITFFMRYYLQYTRLLSLS